MADVRSALLAYLDTADDTTRGELAAFLEGTDAESARAQARDEPASDIAVARIVGHLILSGASDADLVDAAKAAVARAPRTDDGNPVALLGGAVMWRRSGQPQLAEPYFRRVRRTDPAHPEVLAFYREMFSAAAAAAQLLQVLVQARRATTDAALRFALAEEMAQLAEQRLASPDRAVEVWRSVIREDGYDARAGAALSRLYREGGKWTALVDLLKEELERIGAGTSNDGARIEKLLEIAELYRDRLRLDTMALATLQRILEIDPRHEGSLQSLAETYEKAGRFNDLLGVYQRRIEAATATGDQARRVELLRCVAELWMDRLGNPQRALEPLSQVRALAPGDRGARELLAKIHERRRDWRALINLRREELSEVDEAGARTLRIELAGLAESRLGDRREAIAAYNEILAHHGDDPSALDALARLYERESRWPAAAEVLHRKLAQSDHAQAVLVLTELGGIYTDRLHARADAIAAWRELLRLSPGHDKAIRRLRDAYAAETRWDELVDLYDGQQRLADVVDVLQAAADRVGTIGERVALYRRVADLCAGRLGEPERALKALERTLAIQPDNVEVARSLVPIYREQANWARLMSTLEILLRAATDDQGRLAIVDDLQRVAEHDLGSPTLTLQWAAEAYRLVPSSSERRLRLEAAAERADGWDQLSRILEARAAEDACPEPERLELLGRLAVFARDRLFKPDDAQRYFRRIIALDPTDAHAMSALEDIYSATRRWDDLSEVYRRRLDVTTDTASRLATLRGLARLSEEHLGDLDAATEHLRQILALAPDDDVTLDALARIHRNRGQWAALAEALERKLTRSPSDAARVPVMFELALVRASRLAQTEAAVQGLLAVLSIEPMHRPTVEALESLRQSEPHASLAIMRGLLPYYRRVGDRVREAEAMEILVAAEGDVAARREQLAHLAGIYEDMADRREDALRIRLDLFRAAPEQWEARKTAARLGRELGRMAEVASVWGAVLRSLAQEAAAADEQAQTLPRERLALRRDLLLEYAGIMRDELGNRSAAEQALRDVLDQDETHQGAYEALEALLRDRTADAELVALYRRRVDVTFNPREQRELLSRIVDISRNLLGDRATAVATAEELLDLIPDDLATIELLAHMYQDSGEAADRARLEELVGRWAELAPDPVLRRKLTVRRADLRARDLNDPFGAVDLLGQVLGEDPDDRAARSQLEQLFEVPAVQLQTCALLLPLYERHGDHAGRVRVLQARRRHAEDNGATDEAVTRLIEISRIHEQEVSDAGTAFITMREAYLMDPRRLDTREHVERLALHLGRLADLADVWRAALASDRAVDPALRIDLVFRLCVLLDEHLRDQEGARKAYGELLALDPPDAGQAHKAVEALCRLHLEAGDGVALVEAKRQLLRFCDLTADQVRIRLEIADVQEQLGDRVGAALTYSEVLDLQPDAMHALEALERLFLEEEEWHRLVEVLEHRIEVTSDPRARAQVWRQVGEIVRDQIHDAHRAASAFQSVLDLRVGRDDTAHALRALVEINEGLGRWPDVEEGMRRLVKLTEGGERIDLLIRTAHVVGRRLHRGADALALLKRVLDLAPKDLRARTATSAWLDDEEQRDTALRILMPIYEDEHNWPALLELEELQARKQPSGRRRLQSLLRVAKTQEERIGDPDRAFTVLCEAMTEAADQPELVEILDKVARLGEGPAQAEPLLAAYQATVDHILDADLQKRVLRSIGTVALERLGLLDEARRAWERAMDLAPDDADAAEALERIYSAQEDHAALTHLLIARADRMDPGPTRDDLLVRAAHLSRVHLEQPEEAIRLYERLSPDAMARPDVQEVIEPLYEAAGRYSQLAAHLSRKLARSSGDDAVDLHLRLGRLYGERLEDPEEGMRHLSTALRLDPDRAVAADELNRYLSDPNLRLRAADLLEPVFASIGDWTRLIRIQEIRIEETGDDSERVRLMRRIAQIEEEQLEDLERAFESYARVFRETPWDVSVRDQMARLSGVLTQVGRYAELLTEYVTGPGLASEDDQVLVIVREAAEAWAGSLRQPARAVPLWQRLREARPDDNSVFPALESAMTQAELWAELLNAYWAEIDASLDEERQLELLRRAATTAQEVLEDAREAGRAYQRMIELRPDAELARTRLEQILEETGRFGELVDLLRDRALRTPGAEAQNWVYARIADLQDGRLEDPEGAADTLDLMLGQLPDDPEAVLRLERIAEMRRNLRPRLLSTLRPIYERQGNVRRLVEIDEWQLHHAQDPATRHTLYREMAQLLQRTGEHVDAAFRVLCRAVAEPGPADALRELDAQTQRVADILDHHAALADALVRAASGEALASDPDRRVELYVWAGRIHLNQGEAEAAHAVLETAVGLAPDHDVALEVLDRALVRLGRHERLAAVLAVRAEVASDDATRAELMRRRARVLEDELERAQDAEPVRREVAVLVADDPEALERLTQRFEHTRAHNDLVDVLERRVQTGTDPAVRRTLRLRLAELRRDVGDRETEIDVLREQLGELAGDDEVLARLHDALVASERWAEAAETLVERAQAATVPAMTARHLLAAARLYAGPLEEVPAAFERFREVLAVQHDGSGADAVAAACADLVALAQRPEHVDTAAEIVRPHLVRAGDAVALARVYDAQARMSSDPATRVDALRHLAETRRSSLGDAAGALEALDALIDAVEPDELDPVLEQSAAIAVQLSTTSDLVRRLADRAAEVDREPAVRLRLAAFGSRLCEDTLGDRQAALALLVPLVEAGLAEADLCARTEILGRAVADLDAVELALREQVRQADDAERAELLVRLGTVQSERGDAVSALDSLRDAFEGGRTREAVVELERLLAVSPRPSGLLDALEHAYQSLGDRAGQAHIVRERLRDADGSDRARLYEQLGQLCEEGGGTAAEAVDAWGKLVGLDPLSENALTHLRRLARDAGESNAVVEHLYLALARAEESGQPLAAVGLTAAALLMSPIGDPVATLAVLDRVLAQQPDHLEALERAVEAARATGDAEALHDALVGAAGSQPDPERAATLWSQAADVAQDSLHDATRARDDLEQAIGVDESRRELWERLLALLAASGDAAAHADALGRRIAIADDGEERTALRHRLADRLEALGRAEDAVAVWHDVVADAPGDLEALERLDVLQRGLSRWSDVRETLERRLELVEGPERAACLRQLAELAEIQLEDRPEAIEHLHKLHQENPGDMAAERALERLLSGEERWVDLAELLEARTVRQRATADADAYRTTASRLADLLATKVGDVERAAGILEDLLGVDPSHVPALVAMARVHEARGDLDAMRDTLDRAVALRPQGQEGAALHLRLSELVEDDAQRREHLEQAFALHPSDEQVLDALIEATRQAEDHRRVAELLEHKATHTDDRSRQRALRMEQVDVYMNRLDDPDAALRVLGAVYEVVQDDAEINRRIADTLFSAGRHEEAHGMYAWLVEVADKNDRRSKIHAHDLTRLARISLHREDAAAAKEQLLEAYRIDTTNVETLMALGTLHESSSEWRDALKIYRTMLLQNADKTGLLRRGDIYVHLARAHLALEEKPKARAMLRRGLEEDAGHPELNAELAALGD